MVEIKKLVEERNAPFPMAASFLSFGPLIRVSRGSASSPAIEDAGDLDFVEAVVDVFGGGEVTHGGFQRFVAHPVLYGAHVEAGSEHPGGVGRAEFPQVELGGVELRGHG